MVLALDASAVGQGCLALLVNVVHQERALPLGYVVVKGKKGHLSEQTDLAMVAQVQPLIPSQAQVVLVTDGEFDGKTFHLQLHLRRFYPDGNSN